MRYVAFSRIAASSVLLLSVAACGGSGSDSQPAASSAQPKAVSASGFTAVPGDDSEVLRNGSGAKVTWLGRAYQITSAGQISENGVVTAALAKTANVTAIGVVGGVLVHQGGGFWWEYTGGGDWKYLGSNTPVLTLPDDAEGTVREGEGSTVRWQGHVYQISLTSQLTRDGVVTADLAKTSGVQALGIIGGKLVHKGGGSWWSWTGAADWAYLGATLPDDVNGTVRVGKEAFIRWKGRVYQINAAGQITQDGVVTAELAKTANVQALAMIDGVLAQKGGGRWWKWSGAADWSDLGVNPAGIKEPTSPTPTPTPTPTPNPRHPAGTTSVRCASRGRRSHRPDCARCGPS